MYKAIKLNVHCVEQGMYLIGSYQVRNGNEEGLKEVHSKFFNPFKNTYSFFQMYANIDAQRQEKGISYSQTSEAEKITQNAECITQNGGIGSADHFRLCPKGIPQFCILHSHNKKPLGINREALVRSSRNYFLFLEIITPQAEIADTRAATTPKSAV